MAQPKCLAELSAPADERVCQPLLDQIRRRNEAVWLDRGRWRFGLYFGDGDTRLWAPAKLRGGAPDPDRRVLNFNHPLGRKPFLALMLCYLSFALLGLFVAAYLLGQR